MEFAPDGCLATMWPGIMTGTDCLELSDLTIQNHLYYQMGRHLGDKIPMNRELMRLLVQKAEEIRANFYADLFFHLDEFYADLWHSWKRAAGKPHRVNLETDAGLLILTDMERAKRTACPYRMECAREAESNEKQRRRNNA